MKTLSMDLTTAIYERRAIRSYAVKPVSAGAIEQLIDAAVQAPSSMDLEPWAFVVVEGAMRLKQCSDQAKGHFVPQSTPETVGARVRRMLADPNFNIFHDAPILIVICATSDDPQAAEDCCLAAQNLMLAAHARGLGTCPIGFSRPWLRLAQTKQDLGITPSYLPVFPVVVGHPYEHPTPPGRRKPIIMTSGA